MLLRRYHNQSKAVQKTALTAPSEPEEQVTYTLEDIEKMPYFKVKSLAKSLGMDITGKGTNDLKEYVKEYFGL